MMWRCNERFLQPLWLYTLVLGLGWCQAAFVGENRYPYVCRPVAIPRGVCQLLLYYKSYSLHLFFPCLCFSTLLNNTLKLAV
jgi:hypothetical protein